MWDRRPATIVTSMGGQRVIDNNPPPVGVDPEAFSEFLLKLPHIPRAVDVVYASRLYKTALGLIESQPDIAYQLLISTVESLADVAFGDFEPEESEKLATKQNVQQRARDFGLDEEKVKQLALDACEGQHWLKKKFKKFILDFVPLEKLATKDRVFLVPKNLCPQEEDLPKVLSQIYDARSGNLHSASPFPRSIGIGTSPMIKITQLPVGWFQQEDVPPVPWFERVVSLAARRFLIEKGPVTQAPFVESEGMF